MTWNLSGSLWARKSVAGRQRIGHMAATGLLVLGLTASGATAAFSQSSEISSLVDRINRLEQDLNDVQRQVYNGAPPPPRVPGSSAASSAASSAQGISPEGLTLLFKRIDALEEAQRSLTGKQEETTYKLNQISTRLDKLVKDVDFRLTQIEGRMNGQPAMGMQSSGTGEGAQGASAMAAPAATTGESAAAQSGPVVIGGDSLPKGSKVLGTLPANSATAGASATGGAAAPSQQTASIAPSATAGGLPAGSASDQYNYAISLIRADRYDDAEIAFKEFLKEHKDDALAGNAQYWLGETYYVRGKFPDAASAFLNGYQNYPDNSKAADNLLKLAMTLGRMDQKEEACATFAQMKKQFSKIPPRLANTAAREKQKFGCK